MTFHIFRDTLTGLTSERNFLRGALMLALIICIGLAYKVASDKPLVRLIPPNMTTISEVAVNKSNKEYKTSWALATTQIVGNVTPGNADFVLTNLNMLMRPNVYNSIKDEISRQVDIIKDRKTTTNYDAKRFLYEPETDRVFVTGTLHNTGPSGDRISIRKTYEYEIDIKDGRPQIVYFNAYKGDPHTQDFINRTPELRDKQNEEKKDKVAMQ